MNSVSLITDVSGDYYAGMTPKEVMLLGKELKTFNKIDKNKDGILSTDEIIKIRKKQSMQYKIGTIGSLGGGLLTGIGEVMASTTPGTKASKVLGFALTGMFILGAIFGIYKSVTIDKETKQFKKELMVK